MNFVLPMRARVTLRFFSQYELAGAFEVLFQLPFKKARGK